MRSVLGGALGLAVAGCNRSKVDTPRPPIQVAAIADGQPMRFEPNRGQAPESIDFLARGTGYAVYLQPDSATLAFHGSAKSEHLRMTLRGARPNAPAHTEAPLSGTINYYVGNDPKRWQERVSYSTLLGGYAEDAITGIAVDAQGDAYVTGTTYSLFNPNAPVPFPNTASAYLAPFASPEEYAVAFFANGSVKKAEFLTSGCVAETRCLLLDVEMPGVRGARERRVASTRARTHFTSRRWNSSGCCCLPWVCEHSKMSRGLARCR